MSEKLCIVMPVYNEREAIGGVLTKWANALDAMGLDYTIRPYNDGSKDDSLAVMREAAKSLPHVDVHDKPNGGHGPTILQGYREAAEDGFDWVFQIDSDDEMGPESFDELWARRNDFDFLVGRRAGRQQALPRKIVSFVSRLAVRLFYGKSTVWDVNAPYRLMRIVAFRDVFALIPENTFAPNVIITGMAAKMGVRACEMPVPQHDRTTGEVSIKKWKLLKAAIRSLCQTVQFSLCKQWSFRDITLALLLALSSLIGVAFCCSMGRTLAIALIAIIGVSLCRFHKVRACFSTVWSFLARRPMTSFGIIVGVGLIERALLVYAFPDGLTIFSDYLELWHCAGKVAHGEWDLSKSWTTVLFWASVRRTLGDAVLTRYAIATGIQFLTCVFGYVFLRRWLSNRASLVFCAMYFWSVFVAYHTGSITSTEHLYALFMVGALCVSNRLYSVKSAIACFVAAYVCGMLSWIVTWSRGEGILLLLVLPVWHLFFNVQVRKAGLALVLLFGFGIAIVTGATLGIKVNQKLNDDMTVFCSSDNLWPRLFGANKLTGGGCNTEDWLLIWDQYITDHPDTRLSREFCDERTHKHKSFPLALHWKCPKEVCPYVKAEIAKRWREMGPVTAVMLVLYKEYNDWCNDHLLYLEHTLRRNGRTLGGAYYVTQGLACFIPGLIASSWLICSGLLFVSLVTANLDRKYLPVLVVIPLILGNMSILAVVESTARYGFPLKIYGPMMCGILIDIITCHYSTKSSSVHKMQLSTNGVI